MRQAVSDNANALDGTRVTFYTVSNRRYFPGTVALLNSLRLLGLLDVAGAHRMLLFAGDHPILPADLRVRRVAARLGYISGDRQAARRARRQLGALLGTDRDVLRRAALYLSHHGALTCTEREPHCRVCPLAHECPANT